MRYAIGEVLLVMVGILLALQVNNWNEYRKARIIENKVLENLVENIENNERVLESKLNQIINARRHTSTLMTLLVDRKSYSDSINWLAKNATWMGERVGLSTIGYDYFKTAGFGIIKNDELVKEITIYYEKHVSSFNQNLNWQERVNIDKEKFIDEYFLIVSTGEYGVTLMPYNKKELFKSNHFRSLLGKIDGQRKWFEVLISFSLKESEALRLSIINELKTFE